MKYSITDSSAFPLVEVTLQQNEQIRIERGAMVYHNGHVNLEGQMNSNSKGLGGLMKAIGRSAVSGESMFITTATGLAPDAKIGIAPGTPGTIRELTLGTEQWHLNDGAFLACDAGVSYTMQRQSVGKAFLGGTGGFFIMKTEGTGSLLVNAYGDLMEINLDGSAPFTIDNTHVVAWTSNLNYAIEVASGTFGFKTGEGVVNVFNGVGTILIQTRNIPSLADMIIPFMPTRN